jgi:hypothetical protein
MRDAFLLGGRLVERQRRAVHRAARRCLEEIPMLLVIAIVLLLLFGGLGFLAHVLWLGIIVAIVIAIFHMVSRRA